MHPAPLTLSQLGGEADRWEIKITEAGDTIPVTPGPKDAPQAEHPLLKALPPADTSS